MHVIFKGSGGNHEKFLGRERALLDPDGLFRACC